MARKKILWLCSWYPNKIDLFDGDFIQRHAMAAAEYNDIYVIRVVPDEEGIVTDKIEKEVKKYKGLTEHIIYFKKNTSPPGRIIAITKWMRLYKKAIEKYIQQNGKPDLAHVHVPMKAGWIALWLKKKYQVPYIVTEHLGIYNDEIGKEKYANKPAWFRGQTKKIFAGASGFLSVSKFLGEGVNKLVMEKEYSIIPNSVDTDLFYYSEHKNPKFRFLHVSSMVPLKNVEGILEAAKKLKQQGQQFELILYGSRDESQKDLPEQYDLKDTACLKGEISYASVGGEMQQANAFILFSNIENSPCVIGESLCCGTPVIASNVGGIPELVNDTNSILVTPRNTDELAAAMKKMMDEYHDYNRAQIAAGAKARFSYPVTGKIFDEFYDRTLTL